MNFLHDLPQGERDLLVALPYRVGLYISESDETGGDEADAAEAKALYDIVSAYARDVFGSEMITYIMTEMLAREPQWQQWHENIANVPAECAEAVQILSQITDTKQVNAFKRFVLEIGESVALSFQEYGADTPLVERAKMFVAFVYSKFHAKKHKSASKNWDLFVHISVAERQALRVLANSLRAVYI